MIQLKRMPMGKKTIAESVGIDTPSSSKVRSTMSADQSAILRTTTAAIPAASSPRKKLSVA